MAYSHLLVYIYFVFLSIISNFVRLFSPFNTSGFQGCTLANAAFIPPPVAEMHKALDNLEKFLHDTKSLPALIHCGIAHAQF
jgi:hypothetical protein